MRSPRRRDKSPWNFRDTEARAVSTVRGPSGSCMSHHATWLLPLRSWLLSIASVFATSALTISTFLSTMPFSSILRSARKVEKG